jgi:hypothetical protein
MHWLLSCTHSTTDLKPPELIFIKSRGGLKIPSVGTITVCKAVENVSIACNVKNLPTAGDLQTLLLSVTEEVMSKSDTVFF